MNTVIEMTVGGNSLRATGVQLFPSPAVAHWRGLMTRAQQELGGVSSGVGFIGDPAWVISGALVLGAIENAMSSAKAKEGVRTLAEANAALQSVRGLGETFLFDDVANSELPNPSTWSASGEGVTDIDMTKIGLLDTRRVLQEHNTTKSAIVNGRLHVRAQVSFIALDEDFISFRLVDKSSVQIRWSSVDSFRVDKKPFWPAAREG